MTPKYMKKNTKRKEEDKNKNFFSWRFW